MTHHLVLWGGFRLEPSRLWKDSTEDTRSRYAAGTNDSVNQQRAAAELARLERDLEQRGAGLGV